MPAKGKITDPEIALRELQQPHSSLLSDEDAASLRAVVLTHGKSGSLNAAMWLLNRDEDARKPRRGSKREQEPPRPANVFDQLEAKRKAGRP